MEKQFVGRPRPLVVSGNRLFPGRRVIPSLGVKLRIRGTWVNLQCLELKRGTLETEAEHACQTRSCEVSLRGSPTACRLLLVGHKKSRGSVLAFPFRESAGVGAGELQGLQDESRVRTAVCKKAPLWSFM